MRPPQYFHLLWDEEIERLRDILSVLQSRHDEVLERWHQLYTVHFGEAATLSRHEFFSLYGQDLAQTVEHLLRGDMEQFVIVMRASGERLVERGVPFREVISSLHLFEESCSVVFDQRDKTQDESSAERVNVLLTFDKLSHCRMMVLAEAYFGSTQARTQARTHALEQEVARLVPNLKTRQHFHGIVGQSPAMREVFQRVSAAGSSRGTVLIIGESGTGKELVARAIHELSAQNSAAPFVPVNCSALPRELIESELFGYRRGAFSGATTEYQGLFRAAEGGSLFLDEVTEMAPDTQTKLLRVLQERAIRPVGSVKEVPVNVRIIASTNRDPHEAVRQGQLREDLYYRLNVNTIVLPPLRERREDIALLVDYFLTYFAERLGIPRREVEPAVLNALEQYRWPGNIRELMNVIESAYTFGRSAQITKADLPGTIILAPVAPAQETVPARNGPLSFADAERDLIARALVSTGGNKLQAAKILGISRKKLYAKIAKYHLATAE